MKKLIIVSISLMVLAAKAQSPDFHANVTNLWSQAGYKSNVLAIAEQRLNVNSNDIAGLILEFEYQVTFLEFSSVSNMAQRVLAVGETILSTNFVREFSLYAEDVRTTLSILPLYPPNEIAADKQKALLPNKRLVPSKVIQALQDDGYFQ